MKTARTLGKNLGFTSWLLVGAISAVVPVGVLALSATSTLTGCADESDPKTWAKRLDDPVQRATAIKRLSEFFEDRMTKANKNRQDPTVKDFLGQVIEPATKQYTTGSLDEKTRKELIKFLADTRDPRTAPALAKAFNEYEPGKNDEDVKFAAQAVSGMAASGQLNDSNLTDALWSVFSKFQVSKAKSINLVKDLHDAILAAKSPSYGPKAVEKLSAPVDIDSTESRADQLTFWQLTAVQVIGDLRFTPAVKPLVKVLLTPSKADLRAPVETALLRMPKESEPVLISALKGTDPELNALASKFPAKSHIAILGDAIAWISRPAGRDAILAALATADNETNLTTLAQSLIRYPTDPRIIPAFHAAYKRIAVGARIELLNNLFARPALAQASSQFYDPSLVDWLLKETTTAKGDEGSAMQVMAPEAAVKLMTFAQSNAVGEVISKYWAPKEQEIFKVAAAVTKRCMGDVSCYVKVLDEPIPSNPSTANMGAIKAAWMSAMFGKTVTRQELVNRVDKVKDAGARLALVEAIDRLTPHGDTGVADALDKVVDGDKAGGNANVLAADDAVVKVALRLRARAMP